MARVTLAFVLVVLGTAAALVTRCNKPNEEKRCITQCPPQKTCENRAIQVKCAYNPSEVCQDTCVCKQGYFRNTGGDCVTEENCGRCRGSHEYYACGGACD